MPDKLCTCPAGGSKFLVTSLYLLCGVYRLLKSFYRNIQTKVDFVRKFRSSFRRRKEVEVPGDGDYSAVQEIDAKMCFFKCEFKCVGPICGIIK